MLRGVIRRTFKIPTVSTSLRTTRAYRSKTDEEKANDRKWLEQEIPEEHPFTRAVRALRNDYKRVKRNVLFWKDHSELPSDQEWGLDQEVFPVNVDILVIGGGAIGSSIAYWIKERANEGLRVAVVERDPTYRRCSSVLSAGGLRQQFSLDENIEMSLFGAEFLRNIEHYLGIPGEDPIDVQFHPHGYLFLATEAGAETLCANSKLQNSMGATNVVLTKEQLKTRFPWLNTEGIAAGCLGLEKEGWFDPWALLCGLKKKAIALGAEYVDGEVLGFTYRNASDIMIGDTMKAIHRTLSGALIKTAAGEKKCIRFSKVIIAAGANSAEVAEMADIGIGKDMLSVPLPVQPRKRFVYCFHAPDGPGLDTPLMIDPSGTYFRREGLGGNYIAGRSPNFEDEPSVDNLDVDDKFFEEKVWPILAHRVKAFENIKVKSSWAGFYEYNKFDENGIIGQHPHHSNLYFATGFSGHGIQQAPAVGRAIAELIIDTEFTTIDLTRLGFDRFITLEPMQEINIV